MVHLVSDFIKLVYLGCFHPFVLPPDVNGTSVNTCRLAFLLSGTVEEL